MPLAIKVVSLFNMLIAGFSVAEFCMVDILNVSEDDRARMNLGKRELIHRCTE